MTTDFFREEAENHCGVCTVESRHIEQALEMSVCSCGIYPLNEGRVYVRCGPLVLR